MKDDEPASQESAGPNSLNLEAIERLNRWTGRAAPELMHYLIGSALILSAFDEFSADLTSRAKGRLVALGIAAIATGLVATQERRGRKR